MLDCKAFYEMLIDNEILFFAGVPDSLLKAFCAYVTDHTDPQRHIIAANEGNAIALVAGHYLATGRPGLVYMQNSGLGNAINPLTSLVDPEVYSIPMLLLIGWRGEPGKKDEPQHITQGKITLPLLDTLRIEYDVLPNNLEETAACLNSVVEMVRTDLRPYGLVVRKGTFESYKLQKQTLVSYEMLREDAIKILTDWICPRDIVVSTTGKTSRELFEYRVALGCERLGQDFLTVGSMGHASQIALGIALARPDKQVFCLDGDGALIMHMGSLAIIGTQRPRNFKHVIINNGAHDSVGGQPTAGFDIDIPSIARACGYTVALSAETREELEAKLEILQVSQGPALLEIRVNRGARADLGRPTMTPIENKENFMGFVQR
ncbi:MAG: phosphonopyruvate decarboxylase [Anaerolineae bacterium]|jgi:phosphonopyruvate decarboxylase